MEDAHAQSICAVLVYANEQELMQILNCQTHPQLDAVLLFALLTYSYSTVISCLYARMVTFALIPHGAHTETIHSSV